MWLQLVVVFKVSFGFATQNDIETFLFSLPHFLQHIILINLVDT